MEVCALVILFSPHSHLYVSSLMQKGLNGAGAAFCGNVNERKLQLQFSNRPIKDGVVTRVAESVFSEFCFKFLKFAVVNKVAPELEALQIFDPLILDGT